MPISVAYFSAVVGTEGSAPSLKIFAFTSHKGMSRCPDPSRVGFSLQTELTADLRYMLFGLIIKLPAQLSTFNFA